MKDNLRLERAFTEMPPELPDRVEAAFRRGEIEMKRRHRIMTTLAAMAACAVVFAAMALAASKLSAPRPDTVAAPDVTQAPAAGDAASDVPVYYTEGGVYYHGDAECMGMIGASRHTQAEAEAAGKRRCQVCRPVDPDDVDLFETAFGAKLERLFPGCAYAYSQPLSDGAVAWMMTGDDGLLAAVKASEAEDDAEAGEDPPDQRYVWFRLLESPNVDLAEALARCEGPLREAFDEDAGGAALREELKRQGQAPDGVDLSLRNAWVTIGEDGAILAFSLTYGTRPGVIVDYYHTDGDAFWRHPIAIDDTFGADDGGEIVYTGDGDASYHAVSSCAGATGARACTLEEARLYGKQRCPLCWADAGATEPGDAAGEGQ